MTQEELVYFLVQSFGYLGVFLWHIIVSASLFFPLPGEIATAAALYFHLNVYLIAFSASLGSMFGELTGYYSGKFGSQAAEKILKKHAKRVNFVKRNFERYGAWVIFFSALLFFPFDLVSIVAGSTNYNLKKYFFLGLVAKFIRTVFVVKIISLIMIFFGLLT